MARHKLSLSKRFGWRHVRGRRFCRVIMPHPVETGSRSRLEDESVGPDVRTGVVPPRGGPSAGQSVVHAQAGDLIVEIETVPRKRVRPKFVGYAYLSGPALQLIRYAPVKDEWLEPATSSVLKLPHYGDYGEGDKQFATDVIAAFIQARYESGDDVVAFSYEIDGTPNMVREGAKWMIDCSAYEPENEIETKTHLFGTIQRNGGRPPVHYVHAQPPCDASKWAASGFQQELAVRTVFRLAKEPLRQATKTANKGARKRGKR